MPQAFPKIAVFCGTHSGNGRCYEALARSVGRLLAEAGLELVYGGGSLGLMGVMADAALEHGGEVTGITTRQLAGWEQAHRRLTRLEIVDAMAERKRRLLELADGFLVLPGGFGTLDELFEALAQEQLAWLSGEAVPRPVAILDGQGFYRHLREHLALAVREGFLRPELLERVHFVETPEAAMALFVRP